MSEQPSLSQTERVALGTLRYAVNEEAASYLAIMRLFTGGISGFLSDQSAAEVSDQLSAQGIELDADTVDARLSYLVEHGNLARSPRETEARSVKEYLSNRARYQLTQRGELVHRQIEELLGHTEAAREVSSEMLGGILVGLDELDGLTGAASQAVESDDLARRIVTLFAQFERLVDSTRQFYTYLSQVLSRYDLGRDEFQAFKDVLLDYLQRFVEEISRHMPQIADRLRAVERHVPELCVRANAGQRLVGVDGSTAKRAMGLAPEDWQSMHAWFIGAAGRGSDAGHVRRLATDAMRSLLVNLRRLASNADREQSRYGDLLNLALWFAGSDDKTAHELWAAAYGLYSARHLSYRADDDADPVSATASWWQTPVAHVPVALRKYGERKSGGRSGAREDFTATKQARLAERRKVQERQADALRELAGHASLAKAHLSDEARATLLDLYARAMSGHGRPLCDDGPAVIQTTLDDSTLQVTVRRTPGFSTVVTSPAGRLMLTDLTVDIEVDAGDERQEAGA